MIYGVRTSPLWPILRRGKLHKLSQSLARYILGELKTRFIAGVVSFKVRHCKTCCMRVFAGSSGRGKIADPNRVRDAAAVAHTTIEFVRNPRSGTMCTVEPTMPIVHTFALLLPFGWLGCPRYSRQIGQGMEGHRLRSQWELLYHRRSHPCLVYQSPFATIGMSVRNLQFACHLKPCVLTISTFFPSFRASHSSCAYTSPAVHSDSDRNSHPCGFKGTKTTA